MNKTLFFGFVGATGCLVGCLLGEGYWLGIDRLLPEGQAGGSLADPARAPALEAIDVAAAEPPPPLDVAPQRANPPRPGVIGLKNLSQLTWTRTAPDGSKADTRIDFGLVRCEFV